MTQELHPSHPDIDPGDVEAHRHHRFRRQRRARFGHCRSARVPGRRGLSSGGTHRLHQPSGSTCRAVRFSEWLPSTPCFPCSPKGRNLVKVCMGTACYVKGIKEVINRIENHYQDETGRHLRRIGGFRSKPVRCLGACGLAPVMVVNTDTYGDVKSDKIVQILDKYESSRLQQAVRPHEDIRDTRHSKSRSAGRARPDWRPAWWRAAAPT
ncbi:MAG: NAD(P)H-dependent oxidoreductase subunit E [Desulfobacterales bacterium]|nr:NAD(P)H-dependent oxidoreductase subunit E [Desulfobacterales bacterium]